MQLLLSITCDYCIVFVVLCCVLLCCVLCAEYAFTAFNIFMLMMCPFNLIYFRDNPSERLGNQKGGLQDIRKHK